MSVVSVPVRQTYFGTYIFLRAYNSDAARIGFSQLDLTGVNLLLGCLDYVGAVMQLDWI